MAERDRAWSMSQFNLCCFYHSLYNVIIVVVAAAAAAAYVANKTPMGHLWQQQTRWKILPLPNHPPFFSISLPEKGDWSLNLGAPCLPICLLLFLPLLPYKSRPSSLLTSLSVIFTPHAPLPPMQNFLRSSSSSMASPRPPPRLSWLPFQSFHMAYDPLHPSSKGSSSPSSLPYHHQNYQQHSVYICMGKKESKSNGIIMKSTHTGQSAHLLVHMGHSPQPIVP